jgi:hypothetical protein
VEIALDNVVFDVAFGKRAGTVRASIVSDVKFTTDIEYRERQIVDLDLDRGAGRNVVCAAQFDAFS